MNLFIRSDRVTVCIAFLYSWTGICGFLKQYTSIPLKTHRSYASCHKFQGHKRPTTRAQCAPFDSFSHEWLTPAVGEAVSGITLLDRDTEIPTSVNFGGPDPMLIYVSSVTKNRGPNQPCAAAQDASTGTFVDLFRGSAPYLRMHRGATFVIHIPGEVIEGPCFQNIMDDIGLLSLLGVHLVLVAGSYPQMHALMSRANIKPLYCDEKLVIDSNILKVCKEAAGYVRFEIERCLTRGQLGADTVSIAGGNFFSAQPIGVRNGIDYGYSGEVRRIETAKIRSRLGSGDIVQLTSIGFSTSGEVFHVDTQGLAAETAAQLGAEKVIFISEGQRMMDRRTDSAVHTLRLREARYILAHFDQNLGSDLKPKINFSTSEAATDTKKMVNIVRECVNALSKGVQRAHVVSPLDGSLLQELFTRDGSGLLISRDIYDGIRPACASDIPGIFEIIHPLEEAGILVKRSQAQLEHELPNFFVFTRDGATVACAYLKRFSETSAEIGCLAVHPKYRRGGRGEAMLGYLERVAVLSGLTNVFVLSTRTMQWFVEHGFDECGVDGLPEARKAVYNWERKSKVYRKRLDGTRAIDNEELFWDIDT